MDHGWIANLSNGEIAVEHEGDWIVRPGERLPWPRLSSFCGNNKIHITALAFEANGTKFYAPKLDTRFEKGGIQPDAYSIEYIAEFEEGPEGSVQGLLADIGSYYGKISVHTIVEIGGQEHVWTQVRQDYNPMVMIRAKEN